MVEIDIKKGIHVIPFKTPEPDLTPQDCIDTVIEDGLDKVTEILVITLSGRKVRGYSNGLRSDTKVWLVEHYKRLVLENDKE